MPPVSGTYVIELHSDDHSEVVINDEVIVEAHCCSAVTVSYDFEANVPYKFHLEWQEGHGGAFIHL